VGAAGGLLVYCCCLLPSSYLHEREEGQVGAAGLLPVHCCCCMCCHFLVALQLCLPGFLCRSPGLPLLATANTCSDRCRCGSCCRLREKRRQRRRKMRRKRRRRRLRECACTLLHDVAQFAAAATCRACPPFLP
jgi:hypothetical protein